MQPRRTVVPPASGPRRSSQWHRSRVRWPWLVTERAAWALAFVCLAGWGAFYLAGVIGARGEVNRFGELRAAAKLRAGSPDQSLWSAERVRAWQSTLKDSDPPPLAVL